MHDMRFEVIKEVLLEVPFFWDMSPSTLLNSEVWEKIAISIYRQVHEEFTLL